MISVKSSIPPLFLNRPSRSFTSVSRYARRSECSGGVSFNAACQRVITSLKSASTPSVWNRPCRTSARQMRAEQSFCCVNGAPSNADRLRMTLHKANQSSSLPISFRSPCIISYATSGRPSNSVLHIDTPILSA
ncbi:hypothetical protein M404DRAFT_525799 [Pisolithus tinctorius Marx 270]|uniref:Uncharacterized protein n=1 Tax=Pisolithus tinctorius Marx 270 TaxID=870435 RepID=A0A0C3PCE9_PISTI|nr:hypothetical protein M404DRAFT_525799 [Pisolithus tinctorius Marx 270]